MTRGRALVLATGVVATVAALAAVAFLSRPPGAAPSADRSRAPQPTAVAATPSPTPSASTTPSPPGVPDDLGSIAWWDTGHFQFGFVGPTPGEPPATPFAIPAGYRQLRVGTLDGRVTAVRTMPDAWSAAYASGPVRGEVLYATDDGVSSRVAVIEARSGAETELFRLPEIVPAAALAPDGRSVWYVKLSRPGGEDLGLWRRPRDGGAEERVLAGPLGEPTDAERSTIWQVHVAPDGATVAVQWCFGQVRCTTHLVDPATGRSASTDSLGWPAGFTDDALVSPGTGQRLLAVDRATGDRRASWAQMRVDGVTVRSEGSWWVVGSLGTDAASQAIELVEGARPIVLDGTDAPSTTFRLPFDAGVGPLPDGWALRGAGTPMTWPDEGPVVAAQLVHVPSGERIDLEPFVPALADPGCAVVGPRVTPAGIAVGPSRSELRDGVRWVEWSTGTDRVRLAVGTPVAEGQGVGAADVSVRGAPAQVVPPTGTSGPAIVWREGACTYTAVLAPGTPLDAAVEYAGRY